MQKMFSLNTSSGKNDSFVFAQQFVTPNCSPVTCENRYDDWIQAGNKMFTPYFNILKRNGYMMHQQV